jgi:hypothetical protein
MIDINWNYYIYLINVIKNHPQRINLQQARFSFDENGNPLMDAMVLQIVDRTYREVK